MNIDKINGGTLLSVQSPGLLCFYNWDNGDCIRCMEINAKNVSDLFINDISIIYIYTYIYINSTY